MLHGTLGCATSESQYLFLKTTYIQHAQNEVQFNYVSMTCKIHAGMW